MREHTVSTPTGRRILIDNGHGFATIGQAFAPVDPQAMNERLHYSQACHDIRASLDGTYLGPRHLWTIAIGMAKGSNELMVNADTVAQRLFYDPCPALAPVLADVMRHISNDPWSQEMMKHGWHDLRDGTIRAYPPRAATLWR